MARFYKYDYNIIIIIFKCCFLVYSARALLSGLLNSSLKYCLLVARHGIRKLKLEI